VGTVDGTVTLTVKAPRTGAIIGRVPSCGKYLRRTFAPLRCA